MDCSSHFGRAVRPLNRHRPNQHLARKPVAQPMQNIADNCALRAGDHANHLRQERQRLLALCIEQAFSSQGFAAFFQHGHERALARNLHAVHIHVVLRLRSIARQLAGHDHFKPFFGHHAQAAHLSFPGGTVERIPVIFERVIKMPGACMHHTPYLSAHPDTAKRGLKCALYGA